LGSKNEEVPEKKKDLANWGKDWHGGMALANVWTNLRPGGNVRLQANPSQPTAESGKARRGGHEKGAFTRSEKFLTNGKEPRPDE